MEAHHLWISQQIKENLLKLVQIGNDLLKKHASRVNLQTCLFEQVKGEVTHEEAFTKFLSEERRLRCGELLDN